jgi:hypothetical protein
MSVDQAEQDEAPSLLPEEPDHGLPDADDASFASQVEMAVDLGESEDEYMSADDALPTTAVATSAPQSALELEEATGSEEDVDMIDVSSVRFESASPDQMALQSPQTEGFSDAAGAAPDLVMTDVVPEVAATEEQRLPSPQILAQQEPGVAPSGTTELLENVLVEVSTSQLEAPGAKPGTIGEESNQVDLLPTTDFKPLADDVAQDEAEHARGVLAQDLVENALPAEPKREPEEAVVIDDKTNYGMDGASDKGTEAPADAVAPDSHPPAHPPELLAAERDGREQVLGETEGSPPKSDEAKVPEQDLEDETMILDQLTQEQQQYPEPPMAESQLRSPTPDLSVHLARQAVAARRQKKAPEPVRTSPRVTRARSSSLRSIATNSTPEKDEDNSVSLARAALASPSKHGAEADGATAAALKSELTKRLRTELPECVPLKSLRMHLDKFPNAVVVVTTQPTPPARAKGGPREYFMSFHATDPSAAPSAVVEVQLYRPHKDSLPRVRPGDVVLLQRFQVKALSKKGFGLRTGLESAWAVWEAADGEDGEKGSQTAAPQIRGPPVEDWEGCVGYVGLLRRWFGLVMADAAARGKLEKADRKLEEAGGAAK